MQVNVSKKDVFWGYIGTAMSLCSNILILPFIIYFLDSDMLGLWYVFTSIGAIASLFDFGFSFTFSRNITYCWSGASSLKKEGTNIATSDTVDFYMLSIVIKTCKRVYLIIAVTALAFLGTLGTVYIEYVARNISGLEYKIGWFIYLIAIFLNLYYGYYASFLRGVGDIEDANKNTVIARTVHIVCSIVFLVIGMGIIGACTGYLLYGIVFRILGKHKFYHYKGIGGSLRPINAATQKQELVEMFGVVWHNAWRDGVVSTSNYFCNQMSTIICSAFLSLSETGVYSLGVQIAMAIATVAATLYNTYQPGIQAAYVKNDQQKLRHIMSLIVTVYISIFVVGLFAVIMVGLPILRLIKPQMIVSTPVLIGLSIYQFILKYRNCYTSYFSCTNRLPYVRAFVASAFLCVGLSYVSLGILKTGIWGVIISQIASQVVYNLWYWPGMVHKELQIDSKYIIINGFREIGGEMRNILKNDRR